MNDLDSADGAHLATCGSRDQGLQPDRTSTIRGEISRLRIPAGLPVLMSPFG
ncbi:hypothetical protein AAFG07_07445 [Bradyrhizobium sp. B097]|uniref:hypothetical protein n=1 Tax=Bradyrhizobium sp. B097 TaxID=3140244 RepID=UPI003182DA0A